MPTSAGEQIRTFDGLIERCRRAEKDLHDLAEGMRPPEYARLVGKAQGVALVRSYIEEARRNAH